MERAVAFDYSPAVGTALGITSVGRSDTMPGHHFGPAVRPYYLVHYILAGAGTFEADGVTYHLHAGQGFVIKPNQQTNYIADMVTPWSYIWLGFSGTYADQLVDQLTSLGQLPIFQNSHSAAMAECVNEVLRRPNKTVADQLMDNSSLLRFLGIIANSPQESGGGSYQPAGNPYVNKAIQYLAQHITDISVDRLAHAVNLNRSYLSDLFKTSTGLTPSQYIRNFRITKARHLLESSPLSIDQIANRCGYQHANSFARIFKQTYGMSPREYRAQVK